MSIFKKILKTRKDSGVEKEEKTEKEIKKEKEISEEKSEKVFSEDKEKESFKLKDKEERKDLSLKPENSWLVNFVLKKSILTEKALNLSSLNQYVFEVNILANKKMIAQAVEKKYGVKVLRVNIVRKKSRPKSFRNIEGKRYRFKKAIVTLKKGDKIEF